MNASRTSVGAVKLFPTTIEAIPVGGATRTGRLTMSGSFCPPITVMVKVRFTLPCGAALAIAGRRRRSETSCLNMMVYLDVFERMTLFDQAIVPRWMGALSTMEKSLYKMTTAQHTTEKCLDSGHSLLTHCTRAHLSWNACFASAHRTDHPNWECEKRMLQDDMY